MDRREALKRISLIFGGSIIGSQLFLEGCTRVASPQVATLFNDHYIDLLGNIAETILPQTDTPGAKEAGVGSFIPVMVRDCYTEMDQDVFIKGLAEIDKKAESTYALKFNDLKLSDRTALFIDLDKERKAYDLDRKENDPPHFFTLLRQLSILGFFSSEIGATQALRYIAIPGKYDGNLSYKKGDRAWAT